MMHHSFFFFVNRAGLSPLSLWSTMAHGGLALLLASFHFLFYMCSVPAKLLILTVPWTVRCWIVVVHHWLILTGCKPPTQPAYVHGKWQSYPTNRRWHLLRCVKRWSNQKRKQKAKWSCGWRRVSWHLERDLIFSSSRAVGCCRREAGRLIHHNGLATVASIGARLLVPADAREDLKSLNVTSWLILMLRSPWKRNGGTT
jgi:hypothetical protein